MPFRAGSRPFNTKRRTMKGGSRASNRVMSHLRTKGMPNDYTPVSAPMGVEGAGVQPYELTGGVRGKSNCPLAKTQRGGSKASDCTVGFANAGMTHQDDYYTMMDLPRGCNQSGGGKTTQRRLSRKRSAKRKTLGTRNPLDKSRRTKTKTNTKKRRQRRQERLNLNNNPPPAPVNRDAPFVFNEQGRPVRQRGGGFANMTGCGPINYPQGGAQYAKYFGGTSCPSKEELMNPANLAGAETTSLGGHAMY